MLFWFTLTLKVGMIHCCIHIVYAIFFVLEGPVRLFVGSLLVPRMRRKGIYACLVLSAILFIATAILFDNNDEGKFDVAKMITDIYTIF